MSKTNHPAWQTFLENNVPASKEDKQELLTTGEILERLNSIIRDDLYTESDLFNDLKLGNFQPLNPAPAGLYLWMIKPVNAPVL